MIEKASGKYYNIARKIFFNQPVGKVMQLQYPEEEGIKIRSALYVIVQRNQTDKKNMATSHKRIFKSRKEKGIVSIWREI